MKNAAKAYISRHGWHISSILLLLLFGVAGIWTYYEARYPQWSEEVQLTDGRVIVIHQKQEVFDNYGTNQSWIEIDLPELGGNRIWHSYLIPQRIDVIDGKVYVFGSPRGDRQYYYYGDPKNFMVGFVWNGHEFVRTPFLSIPKQAREEENVFSCVPETRGTLLTVRQKNDHWCPPKGDEGQFTRKLNLIAFQEAAVRYSRRAGGKPSSE